MKVTVTSQPGMPYQHTLQARSHTLVSDVDATLKGGDTGPSPHELMLLALGTCTAMTIEMYAARKQMALTTVTITVSEGTIADPSGSGSKLPHIVEDIELEGTLTDAEVSQLKAIGEKCPVLKLFTGAKVVETKIKRV